MDTAKSVVEKNENYWDKNGVKLETVEINVVKDLATGINLYNSGEIDTATLNQAFVDAFKNTEEYVEAERARNYYILFNHDDPFLKMKKSGRQSIWQSTGERLPTKS